MKRIPVALVIGQLGFGGAERQLSELASRLNLHGYAPHVFCLGGLERPFGVILRDRDVPVVFLPRHGGFDLRRAIRLARSFREARIGIVHSYLIDTNPYAWIAAKMAGTPVFIASNRNVGLSRGPIRAVIDRFVFDRADRVVVNSDAVADFTSRRFHIDRARLRVILNGVDLESFRPRDRRPGPPLRLRLGTVGSLEAKKNPALFGLLAETLHDEGWSVECVHLGEGPLGSELQRRYAKHVGYLGVDPDVAAFLASLDVFVLVSDREGLPNVLLEAMASGLPVVSTAAGGVREVLRDDSCGLVVPPGDGHALHAAVARLLDDDDLRSQMGRAARLEVERRFPIEGMVEATVGVYREVGAA